MTAPAEPYRIPFAKVADLIANLGINTQPGQIRSILMVPGRIEVVRYRVDEQGRTVITGNQVATETIVIAVDEKPRPEVAE
jgi:hypothetical protein